MRLIFIDLGYRQIYTVGVYNGTLGNLPILPFNGLLRFSCYDCDNKVGYVLECIIVDMMLRRTQRKLITQKVSNEEHP